MVNFENLSILFLGVEIMSIPLYILAGSEQKNLNCNESALKYFLMGAFATGFLLMGITFIYGETGTFDIYAIQQYVESEGNSLSPLFVIGIIFLILALGFKVSIAPFHFWTPDVYHGAPTFVTLFMSSVVKISAFGAFYRLFDNCFTAFDLFWQPIFAICTSATLIIASFSALKQQNVKRLLAYSSISHAGYMLMALMFVGLINDGAVLYYAIVYALSSIGIWAVVMSVENIKPELSIDSFNGLSRTHPILALVTAIFVLSLSGLPPTAGFMAKFLVFHATIKNGYLWLAILAILNALIGIVYYFKILIAIYFKPTDGSLAPVQNSILYQVVLIINAFILLVLGIFPDFIYNLI
jgi:NADH-quinone oxidoreductase subunit N